MAANTNNSLALRHPVLTETTRTHQTAEQRSKLDGGISHRFLFWAMQ
jgi:hypothetical protein